MNALHFGSAALLSTVLAATASARPFAVQAPSKPAAPIATPEAIEADFVRIQALREFDPDDAAVLEAFSAVLGKKGDVDGQLAYLICALDAYDRTEVDDVKAKQQTVKRLGEALTKLDPETSTLREARDSYLKDLTWALQLYAGNQKKFKNALEVAGRILRYRPDHTLAKGIVDQIKKRNDPALLAEADRLISLHDLARPRSFLVKWAEEHREWDKAGVAETDGYVVRSNIGYDVLQYAARGLDQISRYYASFYGVDRSVQKGKTDVFLCRTRDQWVRAADAPQVTDSPGVLAFIWTQPYETAPDKIELEFKVYGYDPRDVGRPLDSVWSVLWHEASHQYMHMRTKLHDPPPWIDEGMASYFEGARLQIDGELLVGLPASERLQQLVTMLEFGVQPLKPLLESKGLLAGELYPVAWGVVYYLRHEPKIAGKPFYRDLLTAAVKLASERDIEGPELFEQSVLKPLKTDLASFETEWIAAMKALWDRESIPRECANGFLAIGDRELAAGHEEAAFEAFHDALLRAPEDATALLGQARIEKARSDRARNKDENLKDSTLTSARRAHHAALAQGNTVVEKKAAEIATAVDPGGFKKIADAERNYRRSVEALIAKKVQQGRTKTAVALAGRYVDDILGGTRAAALAAELREKEALVLERPMRVFDGKTLDGLSAPPNHFTVAEGELVCAVERPDRAPVYFERSLSSLFRIEGEFQLDDPNVMLAFNFSQLGQVGSRGFVVRPNRVEGVEEPDTLAAPFDFLKYGQVAEIHEGFSEQYPVYDLQVGKSKLLASRIEPKTWVRFRLVRDTLDWLTLELDDTEVAKRKLQAHETESSIGLVFFGGGGRIRNLRAVEIDRL